MTASPRVVIATCRAEPDLQPDDVPLAAALEARGCSITTAPWNGPFAPFERAELVVVRSTWDYHHQPHDFDEWLLRLEHGAVPVANEPRLMRWNRHKGYLVGLAERGMPLPPTRLVAADADAIAAAMQDMQLHEAVVKPVFGAAADGLSVVRHGDLAGLAQAAVAVGHEALVQPLIPEIRTCGETSLTFLASEFSHAVVKRPQSGSILVHEEHGGSVERVTVSDEVRAMAQSILALLPVAPDYARIDVVLTGGGPLLMEVEVIEPELFLRFGQSAGERLAQRLLLRIRP